MKIAESLISIVAFFVSVYAVYKAQKLNSSLIEDSLNSKINIKQSELRDRQEKIELLRLKKSTPKREKAIQLQFDFLYGELEDLCNIYDVACGMYLDAKIDRKRFKTDYLTAVKGLFEKDFYRKIIHKNPRGYASLIRVNSQWSQ